MRNDGCSNSKAKALSLLVLRRLRAGQRAGHADRLERLLAQVVRLLGVQREDLERDLRVRHEERDDGADAELLQRLQPVVAVRRPVLVLVADRDDRIQEEADLLDHRHQPLDVRLGGIALVGRRLDAARRAARRSAAACRRTDRCTARGRSRLPPRPAPRAHRARRRRPASLQPASARRMPAATFFRRTAFFLAIGAHRDIPPTGREARTHDDSSLKAGSLTCLW